MGISERKIGEYPEPAFNSGKWLIFVSIYNLDRIWSKIKTATEQGRLGAESKAATAKKNPLGQNSNVKVIRVYTYDWKDEQDVKKIREELRLLGIIRKIAYKADEDTIEGKYRSTGHQNLSKYYE